MHAALVGMGLRKIYPDQLHPSVNWTIKTWLWAVPDNGDNPIKEWFLPIQ